MKEQHRDNGNNKPQPQKKSIFQKRRNQMF